MAIFDRDKWSKEFLPYNYAEDSIQLINHNMQNICYLNNTYENKLDVWDKKVDDKLADYDKKVDDKLDVRDKKVDDKLADYDKKVDDKLDVWDKKVDDELTEQNKHLDNEIDSLKKYFKFFEVKNLGFKPPIKIDNSKLYVVMFKMTGIYYKALFNTFNDTKQEKMFCSLINAGKTFSLTIDNNLNYELYEPNGIHSPLNISIDGILELSNAMLEK